MNESPLKDDEAVVIEIDKNDYVCITKLELVPDTDEIDVEYKYVGKKPAKEVEALINKIVNEYLEQALDK